MDLHELIAAVSERTEYHAHLGKLQNNRWCLRIMKHGFSQPYVIRDNQKRQEVVAYLQGMLLTNGRTSDNG